MMNELIAKLWRIYQDGPEKEENAEYFAVNVALGLSDAETLAAFTDFVGWLGTYSYYADVIAGAQKEAQS
jgi:hypothetical protein